MDGMQEFEELMKKFGASDGIPVAKVKSLKGVVPTLPWLAYLDEDEQRQFWEELYYALDRRYSDNIYSTAGEYAEAAGSLLSAWRSTAQAHADGLPEIIASATREDFGEVESPVVSMVEGMQHAVMRGLRKAGISDERGDISMTMRAVVAEIFPAETMAIYEREIANDDDQP